MARKINKSTPIRPASHFPASAAVVSCSSSSTTASSDTEVKQHVPTQQFDSDIDSTPKPDNKHVAAEPDSESESESESDGPAPPKPKPTAPAKRPLEADTTKVLPSVKRAKKDKSEPANPVLDPIPVAPGKKLFERLWSLEDELRILKGLNDYKNKKGIYPMDNVDDFIPFIKKTLHVVDANKSQIVRKVRRLKQRHDTLQKRKKVNDPHDIKVLELAKKVWGNDDGLVVPEVKKKAALKAGDGENVKRIDNVKVIANEKGGFENVDVGIELGFGDKSGWVLRKAMKMFEGEEKKEMQTMVDKASEAYLNAYLLRLKVLEVAAKKVFDGINNDQC